MFRLKNQSGIQKKWRNQDAAAVETGILVENRILSPVGFTSLANPIQERFKINGRCCSDPSRNRTEPIKLLDRYWERLACFNFTQFHDKNSNPDRPGTKDRPMVVDASSFYGDSLCLVENTHNDTLYDI